jgi:septum formation inhibitor MinC
VNAQVSVQQRKSLRFRGRSFMALVFAPEDPLDEWFRELDDWSKKSPGYFVGRPIILDVSALPPGALREGDLVELIGERQDVDAVARLGGTIGYEVLTSLGRRFHRRYVGI